MTPPDLRVRRIHGYDFEENVPWEDLLRRMGANIDPEPDPTPPVREAHCRCCGGRAGYGADPDYCGVCRRAGEHKRGEDGESP